MNQNTRSALRVGEVISTSLSILLRNPVPFGTLSVVLVLIFFIPVIIFFLVALSALRLPEVLIPPVIILFVYAWCLGLSAAYVHATLGILEGRKAGIGDCLGRGLAAFFRALPIGFAMAPAIGLGFLFFIIPGVVLYVAWWVAIPVAAVERRGVFDSLRRSAQLTDGNGWRVFGLVAAIYLINTVFVSVLSIVTTPMGRLGDTITSLVSVLLLLAFGSIAIVVCYARLRAAKEGVAPAVAVFD